MALPKFSLSTFMILSILSIYAVHAAHHHPEAAAPSPSLSSSTVDCTSLVMNMAECLSFVTSGSQVSKPQGNCCSGLKTVIDTKAECLCEVFKSSASLGVTLDLARASTLPAVCKIPASSVPKCALSLTPAGAPGGQPSTSSGGASGAAVPPADGKSGSSMLAVPILSLVIGVIIILTRILL